MGTEEGASEPQHTRGTRGGGQVSRLTRPADNAGMLHIDPATLRRHPWIAVTLGLATAAVIGFLLQSGMPEARALFAQKSPESISVDQISNLRGTRWVRITGGTWHCDRTLTTERRE